MRGEWVEIHESKDRATKVESLPMRGEWVEILPCPSIFASSEVSPHAGRVG